MFLIFILLFNAFGSVRNAAIVLANIPLASIGGIVALYLTGIHLSVSAAIGFIALFGQAVLNGVVMVSCFADERALGHSPIDAVMNGATVRLRTVLMTALLAMLGLLPMALSHSIGSEVQKPLAVVVIGGLVSATLLTLIVLPTLYLLGRGAGRLWRAPERGRCRACTPCLPRTSPTMIERPANAAKSGALPESRSGGRRRLRNASPARRSRRASNAAMAPPPASCRENQNISTYGFQLSDAARLADSDTRCCAKCGAPARADGADAVVDVDVSVGTDVGAGQHASV